MTSLQPPRPPAPDARIQTPVSAAELESRGITDVKAPPPLNGPADDERPTLEDRETSEPSNRLTHEPIAISHADGLRQMPSRTAERASEGITDVEGPPPVEDPSDLERPTLENRESAGLSSTHSSKSIAAPYADGASPSPDMQIRYTAPIGEVISRGLQSPQPQQQKAELAPQKPAPSTVLDDASHHLKISAWLTFFSILGTLSRLGLTALTQYNGAPVGGVIWANFAGCLIMGLLVQDKKLFAFLQDVDQLEKDIISVAKKTLPLYIGLTTGFCGSVTSFSSFLLDSFKHLANVAPAYPNRPTKGYNLLALLAYMTLTLSLSFVALQLGAHVAIFLHRITPTIPRKVVIFLDWLVMPVGLACWAAAILMSVFIPKWRADALFACVFAPLGAYGRYWVSRLLNPRVASFPLGTFTVNVLGTGILAALVIGRNIIVHGVGCALMKGAGDGFCGCLTTVSTFVVEAKSLRASHGYFYAALSVVVGLCLMVAVLGSYTWTAGSLDETRC